MSIGNVVKVGIAAIAAVKLASWSYSTCRDISRRQAKVNFLTDAGVSMGETLFATEQELDRLMGEVK